MDKVIQPELLTNERLLWTGQPEAGVIFSKADIFLVPFSILWGGFALFWEAMALASGPFFFSLFGLPFVIVGLYFMFGRFAYKRSVKTKTHYAVTNRRVLAVTNGRRRAVRAAYIDMVPTVNKSVRTDGVGCLTFGNVSPMAGFYANSGMDFLGVFYGQDVVAFYDIKDAAMVYDLVNGVRNKSSVL